MAAVRICLGICPRKATERSAAEELAAPKDNTAAEAAVLRRIRRKWLITVEFFSMGARLSCKALTPRQASCANETPQCPESVAWSSYRNEFATPAGAKKRN